MDAPSANIVGTSKPAPRLDGWRLGLAGKITLPFVALFAALLSVLGLLIAREVIREVETRVENEQRFVLEVATFLGFALDEKV